MNPAFARALVFALFGALALGVGCGGEPEAPQKRFVKLNVKTVDVAGRPVAMVRFYINGKKFGITDDEGNFKGKYEAKDGEVLAFNVEAPQGYSVPPNTDQSTWQITVKYPKSGKLEVDFSATLQRPERDYLFIVRTGEAGSPVKVNKKMVGKTGESGDALLRVSGVPGTKFTASAGALKLAGGVFAEDDEVYLITPKKQGPLGGGEKADEPDEPIADTPEPAKPEPAAPEPAKPVAVAKNDPPAAKDDDPWGNMNAKPTPAARVVRDDPPPRAPEPAPEPVPEPVPEPSAPAVVPEPTPPPAVVPEPSVDPVIGDEKDDDIDNLFMEPEAPPPAAPEPEAIPDLPDDPPPAGDPPPQPAAVDTTPNITAGGIDRGGKEKALREGSLDGDLMGEGDDDRVDQNAIDNAAVVSAGRGPSVAAMSRQEISERLDQINSRLGSSGVLQKTDVDFLAQIDRTHPGYYEANRLLADFYFRLKDYKRQAKALEEATRRGKYKSDPAILLSLAKSYGHQKNYGKALRAMRRVEAKMRRLPARQKADAYRFHAEMLEFEFLRQYHDDPKRANVSLVDKAITKWERYRTFAQGSDPGAVSRANEKIQKLTGLKREMEF